MYNVGVVSGKFTPPHRGHLNAILHAGTKCKKLYVVVSQNEKLETELYKGLDIHRLSLKEKIRCLSIELQGFDFIKILSIDEDGLGIEQYPNGWEKWSNALSKLIPEKIDAIFGAEEEYRQAYTKYFPKTIYELFDTNREQFNISATEIRNNPIKHWDMILGSARQYFVKRILIVGTESCAKTTLSKMLSKIFHTSYALEEGRYYSTKYMGGNEQVFNKQDFFNICIEQRQLEEQAIRTANKITFFDTDSIITQYYCEMYLGEKNNDIEVFNNPQRYDLILFMKPDVNWVDDGFRFSGEQTLRENLDDKLYNMYYERGYADKIKFISGTYNERLNKALDICKNIIKGEQK